MMHSRDFIARCVDALRLLLRRKIFQGWREAFAPCRCDRRNKAIAPRMEAAGGYSTSNTL
jgi:hypothetical protein